MKAQKTHSSVQKIRLIYMLKDKYFEFEAIREQAHSNL